VAKLKITVKEPTYTVELSKEELLAIMAALRFRQTVGRSNMTYRGVTGELVTHFMEEFRNG